jgi:hypothetical protein
MDFLAPLQIKETIETIMLNFIVKSVLLTTVTFAFLSLSECKLSECKFDKSGVQIERFEFLDEYTGNDYKDERLDNRLLYKAYVIHGYNEKCDKEINEYVDNFVCDRLMPNLQFYHTMYLPFFKASKNTNRDNFKVRPKNKIIYAKSNDLLFYYRLFQANDSTIWMAKQKIAGRAKLNPPEEKFYCQN